MSEPTRTSGHVFISYVREDSARVDRLQQILEQAGLQTWRDTAQLWPGQDWRAEIRRAIADDALVFLACFSQASASRMTSYQNEELIQGIEQARLRPQNSAWLMPVRFDDCQIPDRDFGAGRTLASIQRADFFGDNCNQNAERLASGGNTADPRAARSPARALARRCRTRPGHPGPSASHARHAHPADNPAGRWTADRYAAGHRDTYRT